MKPDLEEVFNIVYADINWERAAFDDDRNLEYLFNSWEDPDYEAKAMFDGDLHALKAYIKANKNEIMRRLADKLVSVTVGRHLDSDLKSRVTAAILKDIKCSTCNRAPADIDIPLAPIIENHIELEFETLIASGDWIKAFVCRWRIDEMLESIQSQYFTDGIWQRAIDECHVCGCEVDSAAFNRAVKEFVQANKGDIMRWLAAVWVRSTVGHMIDDPSLEEQLVTKILEHADDE